MVPMVFIWNLIVSVLNVQSMRRPEHWQYWFGTVREYYGSYGIVLAVVSHVIALCGMGLFAFEILKDLFGGWSRLKAKLAFQEYLRRENPSWHSLQTIFHVQAMAM